MLPRFRYPLDMRVFALPCFVLLSFGLSARAETPSAPQLPAPDVQEARVPVQPRAPADSAAVTPAPDSPVFIHAAKSTGLPDSEEVVLLPKVEVRDKGPQLPTGDAVLTLAGKAALLRARYPGATFRGQDAEGRVTPNYGALMYRDDKRLAQLQELEAAAEALLRAGNREQADELDKEAKIALRRRPSPRDEAMDRSVNNDRR